MEQDILLSVKNVSKKFCSSLKHTMLYGMQDIAQTALKLPTHSENLRPGEFWAVRDVCFELKKGECLGIIGPNGAGKTTLLKMLNGIFMPDVGSIEIRGRVGALIQLGAGFHPLLSGRENIYVNAAIMGMSKTEIDGKFDSIVTFAGIGNFLDSPVKYYSSGMYVRLGFAVAAHMDPDVVLLDEVLAVGDIEFQEKCVRYMGKICSSQKAVVVVSHSLYRVEVLCNRVLWLESGKVQILGDTKEVIHAYLAAQEEKREKGVLDGSNVHDQAYPIKIKKVELLDLKGRVKEKFAFGEGMLVRIYCETKKRVEAPLFNLRVFYGNSDVFEASMLIDGYTGPPFVEGETIVECQFDHLPLTPKKYEIILFVRQKEGIVDLIPIRTYATFSVTEENLEQVPLKGPMAINHLRQGSPVYVPRKWRFL